MSERHKNRHKYNVCVCKFQLILSIIIYLFSRLVNKACNLAVLYLFYHTYTHSHTHVDRNPIFKIFYGFGVNEIVGRTDFPNWGFSSTFGIEFLFVYTGIYFSYNPNDEYSWFEIRVGTMF